MCKLQCWYDRIVFAYRVSIQVTSLVEDPISNKFKLRRRKEISSSVNIRDICPYVS